VFRAINAFAAVFWIAFGKEHENCKNQDCLSELRMQLIIVFATYAGITMWSDVACPWIIYRTQLLWEDGFSISGKVHLRRQRSCVESQAMMAEYDWHALVENYMKVELQCGLVLLFFSALPGIALLALASHLLSIRADAFKLCYTHRRPFPTAAHGAGAWNDVTLLLTRFSMITNAGLVFFTTTHVQAAQQSGPKMEEYARHEKWLMMLVAERCAMVLMEVVSALIPESPERVRIAKKRQDVIHERLHEERVACAKCSAEGKDGHPPWPRASIGGLALGSLETCASPEDSSTSCVPTSAPQYEMGRDPRFLSEVFLASHLQAIRRRRDTSSQSSSTPAENKDQTSSEAGERKAAPAGEAKQPLRRTFRGICFTIACLPCWCLGRLPCVSRCPCRRAESKQHKHQVDAVVPHDVPVGPYGARSPLQIAQQKKSMWRSSPSEHPAGGKVSSRYFTA